MTLISRMLGKFNKTFTQNHRINLSNVRRTEFSLDWPLLVKMYNLRMWFLQNSLSNRRKFNLLPSVEQLHNDLNYLWVRRSFD